MYQCYEVRPCCLDANKDPEECEPHAAAFWGVYYRTDTAVWVADFATQSQAEDYANWKNNGLPHIVIVDVPGTRKYLSYIGLLPYNMNEVLNKQKQQGWLRMEYEYEDSYERADQLMNARYQARRFGVRVVERLE